jgi:acyl-CoA synthetase (AMP-forming)/AMP-acid ligase II
MHTAEILTIAQAIVPDRIAMVFDGRATTYEELAARANRLANALADAGVGKGDRVAFLDVNTPLHLETYFAVAKLDAIYVPLNFRDRAEELLYPLQHAAPKVIVAGARYVPVVEQLRLQLSAIELFVAADGDAALGWTAYESLVASGADDELRFPEGDDPDPAVILFTAGTTGRPKAAVLTQASFTSYMLSSVAPPDPDVEERNLLTVPLYHVAGLQSALASVYGGRTLVIQRQFEAVEWMKLVAQHGVERALLVPTMVRQILDSPEFERHDLSSLRVLTYGGSSMPPSLIQRMVAGFSGRQFINAFGQTETGSTITMVPPEDHVLEGPPELVELHKRHLGSIGKPLPDVEVQIVDEDGQEMPLGQAGEIVARGPRLMTGYWGEQGSTDQVLYGGWLHTGDLGFRDEDGYIYLAGRAKDFIKRGGEMVAPEEVENVLHDHPGVSEAAVIGVPDDTWGERVLAIVVARPGAELTEDVLMEHCYRHLARFKRPESVEFVTELPKNSLGKVLKRELREKYGG